MFRPLAIYRNVETGARSHNLRDVLPRRLVVDGRHRDKAVRQKRETIFRGVEFVPRLDALDDRGRALLGRKAGAVRHTRAEFVENMALEIQGAVHRHWRPGMFHLVFHSGGWDSRILSASVRRLHAGLGDGWLGGVLFVCVGNEAPTFEAVMRLEGWEAGRWLSVADAGPLVEAMTDVNDAGRWLNGVTMQAVDYNWLLVERLQAMGAAPGDGDIQLVSGRNETLFGATMPEGNRLGWSWAEAYDSYLAVSRYKAAEVVFPLTDYGVAREALDSSVRLDWSTPGLDEKCGFRRDLAEALWPGLGEIPRSTLEVPALTPERVERMAVEYSRTWYGMQCWEDARRLAHGRLLDKSEWWAAFSAAALCEALAKEGWVLHVG